MGKGPERRDFDPLGAAAGDDVGQVSGPEAEKKRSAERVVLISGRPNQGTAGQVWRPRAKHKPVGAPSPAENLGQALHVAHGHPAWSRWRLE
jgi:hypothetical protein